MHPMKLSGMHWIVAFVAMVGLWFAPLCWSQSPSPQPGTATLADLESAYEKEVKEKVDVKCDAEYQKLNNAYRQALDASLKKVAGTGSLDEALAVKNEMARFSTSNTVPATDEASTTGEVARLRKAWRTESERIEKQRATDRKPIVAAYFEHLRLLEVELTRNLKLEEATAVRSKREALMAANPMAGTAGSATNAAQPPLPILSTVRPAERMDLYASGNNGCVVYVNHKEVMTKVMRDQASKARVGLHEGDVIAVKSNDRFDINSFWLSCISSNGEYLFETSPQWSCYLPGDYNKWWDIKKAKQTKPAEAAPDKQEYVDLVKKSASATPFYHGAQPIRSSLKDDSQPRGAGFYFYVVTRNDLLPKKPEQAGR